MHRLLLTLFAAALCLVARAELQFDQATYAGAIRSADGHVDTDAMVQSLQELGVGTYYWLVWGPHDWNDLQVFLPKAQAAGIQVWPYLVPPSESVPHTKNYSEPFKLDYQLWGEEIAKLSLQFPNLSAWVIDDYYANRDLYTPEYMAELQRRMKAVNPKLAFLPLMYFSEIDADFVKRYQPVIDGVVVAYPQDREETAAARQMLDGKVTITPGQIRFPNLTHSKAGDFARIEQSAEVLAGAAKLRFEDFDDFPGSTAGYHFKQLLIDDEVAWEADAAGGPNVWNPVEVDVSRFVKEKANVTIAFQLLDKQGVANFPVRWRVRGLKAEGLKPAYDFSKPETWKVVSNNPAFECGYGEAIRQPATVPNPHVPFVVMTAAQPVEFKLRHGEPASPERIGTWLEMCLEAERAKDCDGVVTYALDLKGTAPEYGVAKDRFAKYRRPPAPR